VKAGDGARASEARPRRSLPARGRERRLAQLALPHEHRGDRQNRVAGSPLAACSSINALHLAHTASDLLMRPIVTTLAVAARCSWLNAHVAFAADGAVPIDNNASEREMTPIVLNRKNNLFVGNERAGRTRPSSPVSPAPAGGTTWTRNATSRSCLVNLPTTPVSRLEQWLPDQWKLRDTPPPA
jgi:hypothetical protein